MRWLLLFLVSCGTSSVGVDGGVDAALDSAGSCSSSGAACGSEESGVGDFRGATCCSGFCASGDGGVALVCSDPNVDFSGTCAPSPCGGDPTGTWSLVGGCAQVNGGCPKEDAGSGAIGAGAVVVSSSAGSGNSFQFDLHACGQFSTGESNVSGAWSPDAGTIGGTTYCVQGSTLWIFPPPDSPSNGVAVMTALKLVH